MNIDMKLRAPHLAGALDYFFSLAAGKLRVLHRAWDPANGAPVITMNGKYTSKRWTDWTQGFQFGNQILYFDASGDEEFLELGRANTVEWMAPHLSHTGVHDHGFNNVSTYGNLLRLHREGRIYGAGDAAELYALALKVSGAVQAARWTELHDGTGFIYSFNGHHSLFCDAMRSVRSLVLAHDLGHSLLGESDARISLLGRAAEHMANTARYNVYYGDGRDRYDIEGRVAHESLFNTRDGHYRCPSTQQGYSPFTTWTRGLAWTLLGFAEQLEFVQTIDAAKPGQDTDWRALEKTMLRAAQATADFYIKHSAADGIPYWDTGAPGLANMPDHLEEPSQPDNPYEPVDSSAAAIAAQGLLRLGKRLGADAAGKRYHRAGLTTARTLFAPPYLSEDKRHQGLILHSIYHRPNGWDHVPRGKQVPQGESSMWGDYHAMELAVYLRREIEGTPYLAFFAPGRR